MPTASDIIDQLSLQPHPEGGWYRETWRAEAEEGERAAGTAIYYLLDVSEFSHWHRVDAAEVWLSILRIFRVSFRAKSHTKTDALGLGKTQVARGTPGHRFR